MMTDYILYDSLTGRYEGDPAPLSSLEVFERNIRLAQVGDISRRWVPHFTAKASRHASHRRHVA